jgi:PKD repeat protein
MKRNLWLPVLVLSCICMAAAVPPAAADDPPHASFYYSCGTTFCGFDAEASWDDGYITNYRWNWGDGTFTNGTNSSPSHTYAAHGTYTVTLTVTDNVGQTNSTSLRVTF